MGAGQQTPPLVVMRSEADSNRVALRLIGELDLHTVGLLEDELMRTRGQSPPSVIDLSELRFLDLIGLRALLRAVEGDVAGAVRLIGASGIVKRLIELAHTIDAKPDATARAPFPAENATWIGVETTDAVVSSNGSSQRISAATSSTEDPQ
jgi:anti-anti-sigma factor